MVILVYYFAIGDIDSHVIWHGVGKGSYTIVYYPDVWLWRRIYDWRAIVTYGGYGDGDVVGANIGCFTQNLEIFGILRYINEIDITMIVRGRSDVQ